ncbi:hypothetical protein AX774_g7031 [Zancudomyces culisetae]|uniref:Uncharacterized protein n=1 Tax=Zancudomyces culisetae TaxID=1213189 RepID=A0A1R1PF27_ZANCU|nr:hypothetical protein AX774_g7031 [Zancudomyces culisetae]|eukprot:OMH79556.1 hypothetical protein AX774_g7031 [Zancudomyces culisetae]
MSTFIDIMALIMEKILKFHFITAMILTFIIAYKWINLEPEKFKFQLHLEKYKISQEYNNLVDQKILDFELKYSREMPDTEKLRNKYKTKPDQKNLPSIKSE